MWWFYTLWLVCYATAITHAQVITGGAGYALQFNGVEFVSVSRPCGSINPFAVSSVTLESWFQLAGDKHDLPSNPRTSVAENSVNQASIMGLGWEAGYEVQYDYLQNHLRFQTQGTGFTDGPGNPPSPNCWSSETITAYPVKRMQGVWHHIAAVWDAMTFQKSIYLDGELVFNVTCPGATLSVSGRVFYVGGTYALQGLSPNSIAPFYGLIDETRVWSVARTQQQIKDYMHRSIPSSDFPLMISYLRYDEGMGVISYDTAHSDNEYLALDGSLGITQLAWAPKYVPSTAPIVITGETQVQHVRTADVTKPATPIHIGYLDPTTQKYTQVGAPSSPSTVTIRSISDIRYLSYIQCLNPNGTSLPLSLNQSCSQLAITSIPIILPNTMMNVTGADPSNTATLWFDYIITIGSSTSTLSHFRISLIPNLSPSVGSSGYALYCDGINDYGLADNFRWDTSLPVTVEMWALTYSEMVKQSVVFSVGNSEVVGQWCTDNPTGELTRCRGRFMAHYPWNDKKLGWHYGWVPGTRGTIQVDITPRLGQWTHIAMVSDGRLGIPNNGTMKLYANGELIGEFLTDGPVGEEPLKGLLLCDWRYWGPLAHHGYIDNFRIWNHTLSQSEIQKRMYGYDDIGRGKIPPPGLVVAYDFDEDPMEALGYAEDISGNGYTLMFGACQTSDNITEPHTHSGVPHCRPNMPLQDPDAYPTRIVDSSLTPYSDNNFQWIQIVPLGTTRIMITLNGSDPNDDTMIAQIRQLPNKGILTHMDGTLITINDWIPQDRSSQLITIYMNVSSNQGGHPYATFTYVLSDGLLISPAAIIRVDIPCDVGMYLDNLAKICIPCPSGSYQPMISFSSSCLPVPLNSYQPSIGQSTYLNCSNQTFSDIQGAQLCKICSDYDYPSTYCLLSSNVQPKAYHAITVICAILLAIVTSIVCIVIWYRHSRVIFSSSTMMTSLSLIGCLGLLTSVMILIQPQTASLCTTKHWIFHISTSLLLLSLFAKTYRLDSIFNSSVLDSTRFTLSNIRLMGYIGITLLYDIIILAIWNGINPMELNNMDQRTCISNHDYIYQIVLFIPKILMVLGILIESYRVRNIPHIFNETRGLSISMCNLLIVSLIVFLMSLTSSMSYRAEKILISAAIMYVVLIFILAIMGPKLFQLKQEISDGSGILLSHSTGPSHAHGRKQSIDKQNPASGFGSGSQGTPTAKRGSMSTSVPGTGSFGIPGIGNDSGLIFQHASAQDLLAAKAERQRKYRQLDVAIAHAKEKLAALQGQAKQVASQIHVLDMETNYRQVNKEKISMMTTGVVTQPQKQLTSSPSNHQDTCVAEIVPGITINPSLQKDDTGVSAADSTRVFSPIDPELEMTIHTSPPQPSSTPMDPSIEPPHHQLLHHGQRSSMIGEEIMHGPAHERHTHATNFI